MTDRDVTHLVTFEFPDDECLPLTLCVCGTKFAAWDFFISIYRDRPYACPECGAKLYFRQSIKIYEVVE